MSVVIPTSNGAGNGQHGHSVATRLAVPRVLAHFWRWWSGELCSVITPLMDRYWVDRHGTIDIALMPDGAVVLPPRLNGRDVRLIVDAAHVLRKTVAYPAAVEENLADVVLNDLDRQTPFTSEQIYLAHRIERRYDAADGVARIDVELVMVMRRVVSAALTRIRDAGGAVYSAVIAEPDSAATTELLPVAERTRRRMSRLQQMNLALVGALLLLIAIAIAVPILQRRAEVVELGPRVEKARNDAEATRKIEAEFQRVSQEYQLATARKYQSTPVVDIIEELTRLSPDTTWLQSLELRAPPGTSKSNKSLREVQLIGEAASLSKMIELLEQSALLQNTTQRAQTTRGTQPNTERFQIATELKPRAAPELIDVLAIAVVPRVDKLTAPNDASTILPPPRTREAP